MYSEPVVWVIVAIAVVILGLSKGGFAGVGMVSTPLVAIFTDPVFAVGLMLPIMLVQDAVALWLYRSDFDAKLLAVLIPGGAIGILLAYVFAAGVAVWAIELALGLISVAFALWQLYTHWRALPEIILPSKYDWPLGIIAGIGSGVASALAHAGTPPFHIYAMTKRLPKEAYVGTSVFFFAFLNVMKLPSYAALGFFSTGNFRISLIFVPLAVASSWAGAWLVRRVDPAAFRLVISLILLVIGLALLAQSILPIH